MLRSFILRIILILALPVFSIDKEQISFQKLPVKESLPNAIIKRIFQDSRGYIWLGTESGICRYDGYKLKVIKSNIDHPNLLTSGNILCMTEDQQHRMWFGSDRGVNVLDKNDQIIPLITDKNIQNLRINSLICDRRGNVWIGSENGLFVYNEKNKTIKSYYKDAQALSLPGNNISNILEDRNGTVWVAIVEGGICRFDPDNDQFIPLPRLGKTNNPFVMMMDKNNVLWVGAWLEGLFKINFEKGINKPVYQHFLFDKNKSVDFDNSIFSIMHDTISDHIWLLSPKGLSIIADRENVEFENINALELFNDASNFLNHILKDKQGNIWIATSNDGVYLANLNKPLFKSNTLEELKKKHGFINVYAFYENGNEIWVGLANYGIYVVDKTTGKELVDAGIKKLFDSTEKLRLGTIRCMAYNKTENSIWFGGNSILLKVFRNGNTYSYKDVSNEFDTNSKIRTNNISALLNDSKGRMWIGTRQGLMLYESLQFRTVSTLFNNTNTILEEKPGVYWIGSPSKGILKVEDIKGKSFRITQFNVANKKIISDEINAIILDYKGNIWVGTNNGGLNLYDREMNLFVTQNKEFSLLEDDIKSIIDDETGNLWLGTNNKIIKINLTDKTSILFSSTDNIRTSSFRAGAYLKDSSGNLYFGGGNGFSWFKPNVKKRNTVANKITITDIEVHNKSIFNEFDSTIYDVRSNTLHLNYKQRTIGLEFSALNFISPYTVNYAYKLSGVDKDWVYVDSKRRYVNYNGLSKGTYSFEVKSTDENGVWMDTKATLTIIVAPAPYESWWAFMLYLLSFAAITVTIYRTIHNRIRLRRDLLITKIKQEKSEELTQIKLRYFTNVSHELLTPLTIISCLIDDFNLNFPDNFKQYSIMKSNITRLKRLLQQILDFRKMESGNMKLSVKELDLIEFIRNTCSNNFDPLVKQKNFSFSIHAPEKLMASFDTDKIDKILFNLLSNAFKYTPRKGTINLTIQPVLKNNLQYVRIFVNDTGAGIESERLPFIFDRFYGNYQQGESNGIGLSLTKDLVEIHKGSIYVESQLNAGTTFVVELPIDRDFYETSDFGTNNQINPSAASLPENIDTTGTETVAAKAVKNTSITLLIVEDNVDLLMIISSTLSRYFNVVTARNGVEALKKIKETEVDIVISDIMMPEMDGYTLCKYIKDTVDYSHTPVLLLTAKNQIEDRIASYNAGADAYISKPFEMDVLLARINSLILNRQKRNKEFQSSLTIHPKNYEANSIDANFLKEAIEVVESNLDNFDFTHEQLFESLNASKSTLYRKIKSLTGFSPSEFVRNIRLKHACLMLKSGTGNISEIAYAVGFNDPKYFSTCFKNEFGISPREFVKEQKDSNPDMPEKEEEE